MNTEKLDDLCADLSPWEKQERLNDGLRNLAKKQPKSDIKVLRHPDGRNLGYFEPVAGFDWAAESDEDSDATV